MADASVLIDPTGCDGPMGRGRSSAFFWMELGPTSVCPCRSSSMADASVLIDPTGCDRPMGRGSFFLMTGGRDSFGSLTSMKLLEPFLAAAFVRMSERCLPSWDIMLCMDR